MSTKDTSRPSGDEQRVTLLSSAEQLSRPSRTAFGGGADLSTAEADLELARDELHKGRFREAEETLRKVKATLARRGTSVGVEEQSRACLLDAAASAVLGRGLVETNRPAEARQAFMDAVAMYEQWLPQTERVQGQDYTDYAVALERLDRTEEAIGQHERAADLGTRSAETFRALGADALRRGLNDRAEKFLRRALELAPDGDRTALAGLAEALERQGRQEEAFSAYVDGARRLGAAGHLEDALVLFDRALALQHGDIRALAGKGEVLRIMGRPEEGLHLLDQALALQPDYAWALASRGTALHALGRYQEALQALDRALTLDPDYSFAWQTKGQVLKALRRYEEAVGALRRSAELDPTQAWTYAELGETLRLLGRHEEALEAFDQALKLNPDYAWVLASKGQALVALGRGEEAVEALRRSVELDPTRAWVHAELGEALRLLGRHEEALEVFDQALSLEPDYAWALGGKGATLQALGRSEDALQVLDQALTLDPDYPFALGWKGQVLASLERHKEALEALRRSVELDMTQTWVHVELGEALRLLGRHEEALEAFDQALKLNPDYAWALASKGQALQSLERDAEALAALDQAIALSKDYAWAMGVKGQVLCDIGEFEQAARVLDRATALAPEQSTWFGLKGWALEHLGGGSATQAREAYEAAVRLDPQHLWWQKGLADALYRAGDRPQAIQQYRSVIEQATKGSRAGDADILSLIGWCHYRLGQYDEAVRLFLEAVSLDRGLIDAQFDLALVQMCAGRYDIGLREYDRVLFMARSKPALRRRGLVRVALDDLLGAMRDQPALSGAQQSEAATRMLQGALHETQSEVQNPLPP